MNNPTSAGFAAVGKAVKPAISATQKAAKAGDIKAIKTKIKVSVKKKG